MTLVLSNEEIAGLLTMPECLERLQTISLSSTVPDWATPWCQVASILSG